MRSQRQVKCFKSTALKRSFPLCQVRNYAYFFLSHFYFTCTITALLKQVSILSIGVSKLPYFIYIHYAVDFPNFSRISNSFQIILVETQRKSKNKLLNTYF